MDNTIDKKRFNRIFRPFKNKMNELITKDKAEFSDSFSITNGENDLSFSPIDNGLELSTNNANNKMVISNDGKVTINGINIERNKKNIDYDERIKYKETVTIPGKTTTVTIPDKYAKNNNIPYDFYYSSAVSIGNNIYLLGGSISGTNNYKYNITTDSYSKNKDIPNNFYYSSAAVSIGNNIYLLGGNGLSTGNYKYDITTDTYTRLTDIPYQFYYGSSASIGNDIYLLGGGNNGTNNYKYDIIAGTFSKLTDIPYDFSNGSAVNIGTNIYLFGSSNSHNSKYNYKYNTTNNTYTKLADIPYDFSYGTVITIGNVIYILGGSSSGTNNYKYDITSNTYSKLTDIPYIFYQGSAVGIDNDIYLLGGTNNGTNNYKYTPEHKETTTTTPPTTTTTEYVGVIKASNHSIYTSKNKSYTDTKAKFVPIDDDEYYTEYNGNNIVKNTYDIDTNGNTKIYYKKGARINNKLIDSDTEGIIDINILDYL